MITKTKQNWMAGSIVKIGFLSLVVKSIIATPGDGLPDAYILSNQAATQLYKFVPHNGLEKISTDDARILVANHMKHAAMQAKTAIDQMIESCKANAEIEAIFA